MRRAFKHLDTLAATCPGLSHPALQRLIHCRPYRCDSPNPKASRSMLITVAAADFEYSCVWRVQLDSFYGLIRRDRAIEVTEAHVISCCYDTLYELRLHVCIYSRTARRRKVPFERDNRRQLRKASGAANRLCESRLLPTGISNTDFSDTKSHVDDDRSQIPCSSSPQIFSYATGSLYISRLETYTGASQVQQASWQILYAHAANEKRGLPDGLASKPLPRSCGTTSAAQGWTPAPLQISRHNAKITFRTTINCLKSTLHLYNVCEQKSAESSTRSF